MIADGRHSHTISAQDIDDGEQEIANIEAWVRGEAGRELFRLDEVLNEAARWRRMDGCGFVIELDDGGDGDVDEDEGYENVEEIEEPLAEWLALRGLGGPRMIER